jgi:hypothetical protein
MESCIVTPVELKKFTSIGDNVDCELLLPHLLIAQQLFIEPVLGKCLYDDIVYRYDNNQLTGDTQILYEQYIVNSLGFAAWYNASPFLHIRTNRNGLNTSGTDTLTPIVIEEFSMYLSKVENMMRFYLKRLEDFLICNKDKYPLYRQNIAEISPGGSIFTGWNIHPKRGEFWSEEGTENGNCGDCPDC